MTNTHALAVLIRMRDNLIGARAVSLREQRRALAIAIAELARKQESAGRT